MGKSWNELREDLQREVQTKGMRAVAEAIPACNVTVWRLLTGRSVRPSLAIRASIARIVEHGEQETPDTTDKETT